MSMMVQSGRFGAGGPPAGDIEYFSATNTATQSLTTSAGTALVFDSETYDTFGVFASNRFTVPSGMNGYYAILTASALSTTNSSVTLYLDIQRSTDGGTSWASIGAMGNYSDIQASVCSIVKLTTGDIFRVVATIGSTARTVANSILTNFGGLILEPVA